MVLPTNLSAALIWKDKSLLHTWIT